VSRIRGGLNKADVLAVIHGEVEKVLFTLWTHDVRLQSPYVFERAGRHIRERQDDVFACEHTLADPQDYDGHHRMRIAAKKLRYTMEICDAAYDKALSPLIKSVKKLQTLLGDIHDGDVWVDNVDVFIDRERERTVEFFGHDRPFLRLMPGLTMLRDERRRHREQTFGELVTFWGTLREATFWTELEKTLRSYEHPTEPVPALQEEESHGPQDQDQDSRPAQ
jgi:hypothetical protein